MNGNEWKGMRKEKQNVVEETKKKERKERMRERSNQKFNSETNTKFPQKMRKFSNKKTKLNPHRFPSIFETVRKPRHLNSKHHLTTLITTLALSRNKSPINEIVSSVD